MQKGIRMTIFKEIFSGDLFKKGLVINNTPFLAYVTFLMILYVAYGYHVDNVVMKISKESKKGEKLYSERQSALELYDKESLQSKVVKETEKWGLYESIDPPIVIHNKNSDNEK
ncbi:FtsL-like putative cell division protein [Bacteroidota bacterium]|nr:FtsL-like putative cell division protein [Bacteroidota bacterium]PDH48329.1 MAG: hypothetical protein CND37_03735 [Bacteroidetes bacterium MED-G20]